MIILPGHLVDAIAWKVAPGHAVEEVRVGVVVEGDLGGAARVPDALERLQDVILVGGVEKAVSHRHLSPTRRKRGRYAVVNQTPR